MSDESLPEGISGLYLGGGYPELYAKELSGNEAMREAIKLAIDGGMPTIAECGGFLYLHNSLEDAEGVSYQMCDVVPHGAYRGKHLAQFGYVTLTAQTGGLLGEAGTKIPTHEYHYWKSEAPGESFLAQKPQSDRSWQCAYHTETMYAGFPHFHLYARPESAARFVQAAADWR